MKVLLINPRPDRFTNRQIAPTSPLGLLAVASYLQTKGHSVKIVDLTVKAENLHRHIREFSPDIVGVTVMSALASKSAVKVSKIAKKHRKSVIWGGFFASSLPELCIEEGGVDFIAIGEGEITFCELLAAMESGAPFASIDGLAYRDENGVHINRDRDFADLATFPVLDWSLVNPKKYLQVYFLCKKSLFLYFSKGCPAKCTFCFNPDYHRSTHRIRPAEYVVEEIDYLIKNHGIDGIYFADEYWIPDKENMQRFFALIRERQLDFKWGIQTRLGVLARDDLQEMYDAGCRWILFGVESGCEDRVKKIKKGIDLKTIKDTFAACRDIGITTQSAFIIGYPDETEEEIKKTIRLAFELNANLCPFSILYFQPRSEMLHSVVSEKRFSPPTSFKAWSKVDPGESAFANLSKVPYKDLKVIHYYFQWRGFSAKESITNDSYGVAKKVIADVFERMFKYGVANVFITAFVSAKQMVTILWYAKAYPKIRKKYGLK